MIFIQVYNLTENLDRTDNIMYNLLALIFKLAEQKSLSLIVV